MSELYKTLVMERRPRLQSCNVFLIFNQNIEKNMTVTLKANEINISANDKKDVIHISDYKIIINSLSSLQINENYLTFRFQTENMHKTVGQFKSEFIMYNFNGTNSSPVSTGIKIEKDKLYTIKCINCQACLSNKVTFKRILPLPSENAEPSEWFCHKHDNESVLNLNPNVQDCFYSNCYFHVNEKIFTNYRVAANSVIVCRRCLAWLGVALKSNTIQIWFNTVILDTDNSRISSIPIVDFLNSVECSLTESLWTSNKILFECSNHNNNNNCEYLCIWILEKNLQLCVKGHTFQYSANNSKSDTKKVAKVLFRFDAKVTDLITEWMNDVKVNRLQISKPMMISGLNHLFEMSHLIPDCFRKSNGFYVSYLIL